VARERAKGREREMAKGRGKEMAKEKEMAKLLPHRPVA